MRGSMMLGILGVVMGLTGASLGLYAYEFTGTFTSDHPYASRLGFGILAFVLALVIGVGASLLRARPDVGAALMIAASIGGALAMSMFMSGKVDPGGLGGFPTVLFTYAVAPSLLGAALGVQGATPTPTVTLMRWLTLLLLAASVAGGYLVAGLFGAVVFAVPFLIAAGLVLTASNKTSSYPQG